MPMPATAPSEAEILDPKTKEFYLRSLELLDRSEVPYLVGGAYSLGHHCGVVRHTKDCDVFVRPADCSRALEVLDKAGLRTELTFPHWLGKAYEPKTDAFLDVIFASGNGLCAVDDEWFEHAIDGEALGRRVLLCPAEEVIWSKAFIQERERYDGADVAHLLREVGPSLDWPRLLMRFGDHWRVLLSQLILFGFVYPDKRENIPVWVMEELIRRLSVSRPNLQSDICYGTMLSREQYLHDIDHWKYRDSREEPNGPMTREQIDIWTAAIGTVR